MPVYGDNLRLEVDVRKSIRRWRDGLVNLTGTNRLLNLRSSKMGMLMIARPEPSEVLVRVRNGHGYGFRALQVEAPPEHGAENQDADEIPPSPYHLDVDRNPDDLGRIVRGLYRRSTQAYLDQGLSVLYLAFGTLAWAEVDHTPYRSPLLLVPVRLETAGPGTLPTLAASEDDILVNPALALKLAQFGVTLPAVETLDEDENGKVFFDRVRAAVADHKDWIVTEDLVLSYFSFAKEVMYRDLLDNEDLIAGHEAVQALALSDVSEASTNERFAFDQILDRDIDEKAPPEEVPLILDADSSQRACVAAALDGKSFVMDGPPGTGKSQTIANIIGVLLRAGKTILFVSEKAAALDVVRDRLADRGLGAYLLELHSAKATRKQVADELGMALVTEQVPPRNSGGMNPRLAAIRRTQLNQYADAMNRKRDPLGRSLHDVLGRIGLLHHVPIAPLPAIDAKELSVERYSEIIQAAQVLSGAWRPVQQGSSFAWREVIERSPMDFPLQQAYGMLATLSVTKTLNEELAEVTGLTRPSDAPAFAALLDHLAARPAAVPDNWLTADRLALIDDAISKLASILAAISAATDEATYAAGTAWQAIPQPDTLPEPPELDALFPRARDVSDLRADEITALANKFHDDADLLANRAAALASLATMLGLRTPASFSEASDVLSLALLPELSFRPERIWLTPDGYTSAQKAADSLHAAADVLAVAEAAALTYYTPQALAEDAAGLTERMSARHGFGKLSGSYRADKKAVAAFTLPGVSDDVAHRHLGLVVAWQDAVRSFAAAEQAQARVLGGHYIGRNTNFTAVARALGVAETALRLVHGQNSSRVADYLAGPPETSILNMAATTVEDLRTWRSAPSTPPELATGSIAEAIAWLRAERELLETTSAVTRIVSDAVGRRLPTARRDPW